MNILYILEAMARVASGTGGDVHLSPAAQLLHDRRQGQQVEEAYEPFESVTCQLHLSWV